MSRITQKEIAARLGLTQSGVSRGLRNDPRIPAETRMKIKALCTEVGYRPCELLSELAGRRWRSHKVAKGNVIAFINRLDSRYLGGSNLTPVLRAQAAELGYDLAVFNRFEFESSVKLEKVLRNRGITRVILGAIFESGLKVELDWSKFICVQISPGLFPLPLNSVIVDYFNSVVLAWEKAVSHGYERIGVVLVTHPVRIMDDILRRSAVDACQKYLFPHLPRLTPFFYHDDPRAEDFLSWVEKFEPEIIIAFHGGHLEIYRGKFHREIPYISLHTTKDSDMAGVLESSFSCAREAVNLLHACHRSHQWGIPKQRIDHLVEPMWHQGKTLPQNGAAPATC